MNQAFQHSMKGEENQNSKNKLVDAGPQTFFYTLTNMLDLSSAKNILEVGCGGSKLISTVIDLKSPSASYLATDLSENMIKLSKERLRSHFDKYESSLSFDQWLNKINLSFQVQDGYNIAPKEDIKFDRIIANMVLCHTSDPLRMLKSWNQVATQDCIIGISLLGDFNKNQFLKAIKQSAQQLNQKLPQKRQPYQWYNTISNIVEESGWSIILQWQQNGIFPFLQYKQALNNNQFKKMIENSVAQKIRQSFNNKMWKLVHEDKKGIQFSGKLIIAKKCSK